MYITLTKL